MPPACSCLSLLLAVRASVELRREVGFSPPDRRLSAAAGIGPVGVSRSHAPIISCDHDRCRESDRRPGAELVGTEADPLPTWTLGASLCS
jgi:hypothetical protein